MRYLINSMVVFNPADYTLISNDKSVDMLTLSRISGELLQLFIIHNDAPLSRDAILFELWEKRGLNASSNNLNNYVSMLRKALMQCGCEGLITTIPKHGFIFSADVTVQPPAEVDTGLPADIMPELNHVPPVMPRKNIIRTGGSFCYLWWWPFLSPLCLTRLTIIIVWHQSELSYSAAISAASG